ncbi:MAG: putative membrane-bound dehydrogenase-like protein [Akkermansiaceae bacterium]|jgi:putative membrane-bound dehydrogenase-like protein
MVRTLLATACFILASFADASGSEWTQIAIPTRATSDSQNLWLRCFLQVPERLATSAGDERDLWRSSTVLAISDLPGEFEIFLNGQSIVTSEGIPLGKEQRFKIPKDVLGKTQFNALVIRIDHKAVGRGFTSAPVLIDYFNELILGPEWEYATMKPSPAEFEAQKEKPAIAAYSANQFKLSSRPLARTMDPIRGRQVPPGEDLALLQTDEDLAVEALLSEPEIAQPTHFSFDTRGRMWVAQYRQYPYPAGLTMVGRDQYYRSKYDRIPPAPPHHDRGADIISVHEDLDGDGSYETSKNVLEGLNMANSIVRGWGGLWVMHTPYLLFYRDEDSDDIPEGDPEIRLAGFGLEDTHSVANGLTWGPDGWLYGGQGSTTTSRITRPGFDDAAIYNEGPIVWRYHPHSREFEVFADGGGNTFGLSFDAEGRLFSGHNGGNTRGFHFVQNGQYLKQGKNPGKFGPPPNPFSFGELSMMASTNPIPRFSHLGISVDATALPARLQGQLLSVDPLHHNLVASTRTAMGSTFQTSDTGFPLRSDDLTFRPVYLANAPCGGVIFSDFREQYIAHGQNYQGQIDPDSGRIYRLRGKEASLIKDRNLEAKTSLELVALLDHDNLWHRQTAVRLLAQRADLTIVPQLEALLAQSKPHPALEALWVLHQTDQLHLKTARLHLDHPAPMVRAWVIRLSGDDGKLEPGIFDQIKILAKREANAEVQCQVLSTASRLQHQQGLALAREIIARPDHMEDPFIPLMAWHVVEGHCEKHAEAVLATFNDPRIWSSPFFLNHLAPRLMRRFAEAGSRRDFLQCAALLELAPHADGRAALMKGFEKAFERRTVPLLPDELTTKLDHSSLSMRIRAGDSQALAKGIALLSNHQAAPVDRLSAIRAFGSHQGVAEVWKKLLAIATSMDHPELSRAAIVALQIYDDKAIGVALLKGYPKLTPGLQASTLNLLASRPVWAVALLEAIGPKKIPIGHFDQDLLARLALHDESKTSTLLLKHFPDTEKPTPSLRADVLRKILSARPGDPYAGESIFTERCASCHKLFFKGGEVGPDLTRYQRDDLGTMLVSILEPNAEIREGYENVVVTTTDKRILSGFLSDEDTNRIVLRGFDGADITIPRKQMKTLKPAGRSLMPAGLLNGLDETQLRDLFAYLRISQPITK